MSEKILFVDDDPNLLAGVRRSLHNEFDISTALGGEEGLKLVTSDGPYSVILADMRMPGMDGIQFLSTVRKLAPDSVRVMLTGNADMDTAVNAVNEGHIFRFLSKPCPKEILANAVQAGIRQYNLIVAERQLLEETLNGSIKVLTDILSLLNPVAFGRAGRIRRYVSKLAEMLALPDAWQYEVAAMLSQIGCVSLPDDTLEKAYAGQELSPEQQKMFSSHPEIGGKLIINIPRLETVAHMIARQQEPFSWDKSGLPIGQRDAATIGGQLLKTTLDFDRLIAHGFESDAAIAELAGKPDIYDQDIVAAMAKLDIHPDSSRLKVLVVAEMDAQMILRQDVLAKNGRVILKSGQELTIPILEHLQRWALGVGVQEPIRVLVPKY